MAPVIRPALPIVPTCVRRPYHLSTRHGSRLVNHLLSAPSTSSSATSTRQSHDSATWLGPRSRGRCSAALPLPVTFARNYASDKSIPWTRSTLPPYDGGSKMSLPNLEAAKPRIAYIALGSNLGDRIGMIEKACNEMSARGITVLRTSTLWETEPMYVLDQDSFVNGVCEVETTLEPLALLDALQDIERTMGRRKIIDKGPRNIDLDILLYEDRVVDHPRLKLPHAGIAEREFVLRPLADLIPHKPIYTSKPWRLTQDYLNALPPLASPMSTLTPMATSVAPLRALQRNRQTHVMAILNLTPDSFSDGGVHTVESLSATVSSYIEAGASIFDIGGQSSAPGTPDVTAEEEIARVVPVIKMIRRHPKAKDLIISVDTYRAAVAEATMLAGADIVNDVAAGTLDAQMLKTVAKLGKTVCLMHMRGTPATMNTLTDYEPEGLIPTIAAELLQRIEEAEAAGIRRWRIILDPGIGFAKTQAQNLEILRRLDELRDWPGLRGLPWLLGTSRKTFIGRITGVKEPRDRVWGTAATVAASIHGGADIVRVHDVHAMAPVAKMSDAIWRV